MASKESYTGKEIIEQDSRHSSTNDVAEGYVAENADHLQRRLGNR